MILIIGLGNPSQKYQKTRHNVGFMVVENLRKKLRFDDFKPEKKFQAEISTGHFYNEKIILARPLTFMNNSGQAVQALKQFYKIDLNNLWIIHDDIDLPLGTIRIREEGSAGTHNGLKSVVTALGSQDFPRFKVGIESRGKTAARKQEITSFVLSKFSFKESLIIKKSIAKTTETLLNGLAEGLKNVFGDKTC